MNDRDTVAEVAYSARNKAHEVERTIAAHEDLCAERYGNINTAIREIKAFQKWAGTTAFGIIIALLGFLAMQVFNSNEAAKKASAANDETVRQQLAEMRARQAAPQPSLLPRP